MEKEYNLAIRGNVSNARGTIHPTAISRGFSLPLDPTDYKSKTVLGRMNDEADILNQLAEQGGRYCEETQSIQTRPNPIIERIKMVVL